jgi:hypothetical protein
MRGLHFRATEPGEADRIREFLAGIFHLAKTAPPFDPRLMHWKYYQPRPDWEGSRSYVLERDGKIASHGCVWPMPFVTPNGKVAACQIIDWAAAPRAPGAGMLLRREIEKMVAVSVAIGGSPDTRKVIPGAGYATVASFRKFARVVRPFRQFRRRPQNDTLRNLGKLARNTLWSMSRVPALPENWSVEPMVGQAFSPTSTSFSATARTADLYRYLLDCPTGSLSAFVLKKEGREAGCFLLNQVDGQTRIADLQCSNWREAVSAATHTAAALPETCEIVANTSLDVLAEALGQAGYRLRGEQPVFLLDKSKALGAEKLHITSADYDDFFSRFPDAPFAT